MHSSSSASVQFIQPVFLWNFFLLRWYFPIFFYRFVPVKSFYVAKNGLVKSEWILPMAFSQVQPVLLARFLSRRNCVFHANNVKDQVYDCASSALQPYRKLLSASKKKILVNKIHLEYETLNFVGCQSSFKSLTSINTSTICVYSTNQQLYVKDQHSQPTICKPKGVLPHSALQSFLCMCFYNDQFVNV